MDHAHDNGICLSLDRAREYVALCGLSAYIEFEESGPILWSYLQKAVGERTSVRVCVPAVYQTKLTTYGFDRINPVETFMKYVVS